MTFFKKRYAVLSLLALFAFQFNPISADAQRAEINSQITHPNTECVEVFITVTHGENSSVIEARDVEGKLLHREARSDKERLSIASTFDKLPRTYQVIGFKQTQAKKKRKVRKD